MTSREFCYWLQGYFELLRKVPMPPEPHGSPGLNGDQAECIERHLALVFKHEIDPSQGTPEHQAELQKLHDAVVKAHERIEEVANRPTDNWRDTPIRC